MRKEELGGVVVVWCNFSQIFHQGSLLLNSSSRKLRREQSTVRSVKGHKGEKKFGSSGRTSPHASAPSWCGGPLASTWAQCLADEIQKERNAFYTVQSRILAKGKVFAEKAQRQETYIARREVECSIPIRCDFFWRKFDLPSCGAIVKFNCCLPCRNGHYTRPVRRRPVFDYYNPLYTYSPSFPIIMRHPLRVRSFGHPIEPYIRNSWLPREQKNKVLSWYRRVIDCDIL